MKKSSLYLASAALALAIAASPASAQYTITAGDDGLSTTPGATTVNLSRFPIEQVFGAPVDGNPEVSLRGRALGPQAALAGIDTIVRRPQNIVLTGGVGSGPIVIMGLRLESESSVSIGGRRYAMQVFLSEFRNDVLTGTLRLQATNGDGGVFTSSFNVRPRLVFDDGSGSTVVIDCGAVSCGGDLALTAANLPFTRSGGPGGFKPSSAGIKPLLAGIPVDGDGNGSPDFTTRASTNFFIGIRPVQPYIPDPLDKNEQSSGNHNISVSTSLAASQVAAF
jgi:hypothetical protein